MIAAEQGQEAGLRAGGALDAAEAQRRQAVFDLVQVQHEIVAPQAGALAHGGELRRLKMGEAERGRSRQRAAKRARASMTPTSRSRSRLRPSRIRNRSVLSVT